MIVKSRRKKGDFNILNCRYFGGGDIDKLEKSIVAERGRYYAHAKTIKEAISSVNFKYLQDNFNASKLVEEIKNKKNC